MEDLARGSLAGLIATLPMTGVLLLGQRAGLLRVLPPEQITERALTRTGLADDLPPTAGHDGWMVGHLGYGAACGALYAPLARRVPLPPGVAGLGFGLAVWATSYLGLMPGLGLYPPPNADRPSRVEVMIAAHVVYGLALAASERWLRGRTPPGGADRAAW